MSKTTKIHFPALLVAPRHTLRNLTLFLPYHLCYCARAAYAKAQWLSALDKALSTVEEGQVLATLLHSVIMCTLPPSADRLLYMMRILHRVRATRDSVAADALLRAVHECAEPTPPWGQCDGITFVSTRIGG